MKDLGEIQWLLNLKIDRDKISGTINIFQEAYIDNILAWCEVCLRYFYQKPAHNGLYADGL